MDLEKRINKIIDSLSIKYDFFYLIKKNKVVSFILFIMYLFFVLYVLDKIYSKYSFQGIIDNILPFFVDIAIVFLITIVVLIIRTIYNDENGRIDETKESNYIINHKIFFDENLSNIKIIFNKQEYYQRPQIIENLLKWVDFDKDDYFRTHYGSLDISKIALKKIIINNSTLELHCNQASFYDIAYTHYFPDYKLSSSSSNDTKKLITLRNLLSPNINEQYSQKNILSKNIELFDLLPNPIGITGIVTLKFKDKEYYILQVRHKSEAAAKDKIQWSFAGTIDSIPNLYKDTLLFKDLIDNELNDEIIYIKDSPFSSLVNYSKTYKLIGFVLNPLYLYQPEFFASVIFNINDKCTELKKYLEDNEESFIKYLDGKNEKINDFITISDLNLINKILNHRSLKTRNLFMPGYEFLTNKSSKSLGKNK